MKDYCNSQNENKIIISESTLNQLNKMYSNDQKYRAYIVKNINKLSAFKQDSLWSLQNKIDKFNTVRLISIIEKYGYFDSGNSNSRIAIHIILMHTPNELKKEVFSLIIKEYEKGRVNEASYGLITWHLKGRPRINLNYKKTQNDLNNRK
jgi:hypothetical protein